MKTGANQWKLLLEPARILLVDGVTSNRRLAFGSEVTAIPCLDNVVYAAILIR